MTAPVAYEVRSGRLQTWSLEAHAVSECNLRCAQCCALAPHVGDRALSPEALKRDLELAREVVAPRVFKLTGGEPLLNPRLVELAQVARASGIAPRVQLTTNGLLLARQPDELFQAFDRIQVSWYTSAPVSETAIARFTERCDHFKVELEVRICSTFQTMTPPGRLSAEQARDVFGRCWLRHRCHTLRDGRLYSCTRPTVMAGALRRRGEGVLADQVERHARIGLAQRGPFLRRLGNAIFAEDAMAFVEQRADRIGVVRLGHGDQRCLARRAAGVARSGGDLSAHSGNSIADGESVAHLGSRLARPDVPRPVGSDEPQPC